MGILGFSRNGSTTSISGASVGKPRVGAGSQSQGRLSAAADNLRVARQQAAERRAQIQSAKDSADIRQPGKHGVIAMANPDLTDGPGVRMLGYGERFEKSGVFAKDGLLVNAKGEPLNTGKKKLTGDEALGAERRDIFAMDRNGNLFSSGDHVDGRFHHSSLVGGDPILAAGGEWEVRNGRPLAFMPATNHFLVTDAHMAQVPRELESRGVRSDGMWYENRQTGTVGYVRDVFDPNRIRDFPGVDED